MEDGEEEIHCVQTASKGLPSKDESGRSSRRRRMLYIYMYIAITIKNFCLGLIRARRRTLEHTRVPILYIG